MDTAGRSVSAPSLGIRFVILLWEAGSCCGIIGERCQYAVLPRARQPAPPAQPDLHAGSQWRPSVRARRQDAGAHGAPAWPTTTTFDIDALYSSSLPVSADPLIAPFTEQEARTAVRAMNGNSSPGPDGFGLGFYSAAWNTVSWSSRTRSTLVQQTWKA